MSKRKVVKKKLVLVVYKHPSNFNSVEYVGEVLRHAFGYDYAQALNCATLINANGQYHVKWFKMSEMQKALAYEKLLNDQDVPAVLITTTSC